MDQLDQQRERTQGDLRGLIAGDVRCDDTFLHLYSGDGSVYQIKPLGVVRPRSTADVVACVQYAAEKQIPIHARGAGTGAAGAALGPGLVLDFSRYLRRILATDRESVRVQAGVVYERLCAHLRPYGRLFGPNPATAVTTIGSMVALDASGSRRPRYGSTRRHVLGMQVVLADGKLLEVGREPLETAGDCPARKRELVSRLSELIASHSESLGRYAARPASVRSGYQLSDVLDDGHLDLARLLVGSEGTLALVTEVTLATIAIPRHRGVALLLFDSLEKAARAVPQIMTRQPSACELIDRRHLTLVRDVDMRLELLIPRDAEAAILVELEGDNAAETRQGLQHLVEEAQQPGGSAVSARVAFDSSETELFWQVVHRFGPAFYRLKGPSRPVPVVEDMSVPPEVLPEFLLRVQNVLKRYEITASLFAHAGHGQVHLRPFLDLSNATAVQTMRALAESVYGEALVLGGSVGGESACGLSRTSFLQQQWGELYGLFRQVKQIFDPANLLNPGKIVGDDADLLTRNLRPTIAVDTAPPTAETADGAEAGLRNLVELQLNWDPTQVAEAADQCNSCGECRTQSPGTRMCPIFRIAPAEEASPRAKAVLVQGLLTGRLPLSTLTSDDFKAVADLCVHCHMCRLECPAAVDIPTLMREAKGAYTAANGLTLADSVRTRIDRVAAWASRISPLANWALGNWQMRWLLEKTLLVARTRKLPRVAARSFLRRAARRRLTRHSRRSGQKVLYFYDVYVNYFDPQLGEALVAVLEHNGIEVYVHPGQRQAGMPAMVCGALDYARELAEHNVTLLAEAVRQGYHIVATEPTAALCLIREYPQLVDDDDARLVAENTSEACSYLWKLHTLGRLQLDLQPINMVLGYHMPCHLKALAAGPAGKNLLGLIPGLQVRHIEEGCSGMAGTYGLLRHNFRNSLRIGRGLFARLRDPEIQAGTTECSACKMQMEQGTFKPTIHPLKMLALAYDLMPEVETLLSTPSGKLTIT